MTGVSMGFRRIYKYSVIYFSQEDKNKLSYIKDPTVFDSIDEIVKYINDIEADVLLIEEYGNKSLRYHIRH